MGMRSVVFGHIHTLINNTQEMNHHALRTFPYDDRYPFPDIFRLEDAPRYQAPSILFGGTFKQIEDDWLTWFDRFLTMLSTLEAIEANVILDCIWGRYAWTLGPHLSAGDVTTTLEQRGTLTGQGWCIIQAPMIPDNLHHLLRPAHVPVRLDPNHLYGY